MDEATVVCAVAERAERLAAVAGVTVGELRVPDTENRDGAEPYLRVQGDELCYRANERGKLLFDRRSRDLDQLCEWVCSDLARGLAMEWELHHRVPGTDTRRGWFAKWIEYTTALDPAWGAHAVAEVDRILAEAPYDDEAMQQVDELVERRRRRARYTRWFRRRGARQRWE